MTDHSQDNRRIAKNAIFLYIRMAVIMAINFYTTRILLKNLGIVEYGIFNVVGGIIVLIGFITSSMSGSIQRFIVYELGLGEKGDVESVFGTSKLIQILFSILILVLAESVGLWFLKFKMQIPEGQEIAAIWVYQCSVITTIIAIISIPYMSLIIAKEKMESFAYISILDAALKLFIVLIIAYLPFNRLICYAILLVCVQMIIRMCYTIYCRLKFQESRAKIRWDARLVKKIGGFASWTTFGSFASVLYTQGVNIILNIFFGPIVNAARGVSVQVQSAINQFCVSFQTAMNPQITKSVAKDDYSYLSKLICTSSKFSFYLLFLISLPLLICTSELLGIWLEDIPEYTVGFVQLTIGVVLLNALSNPLTTAAMATGHIKYYQIVVGGILLLIVPAVYICFKLGCTPYMAFVTIIIAEIFAHILRLYFLHRLINFNVRHYIESVWIRILPVVAISSCIMFEFQRYITNNYIVICLSCFVSSLFCILGFGLSKNERNMVRAKMSTLLS